MYINIYINTYPFYIIVQGQVKRLLSVNHVLSRTCKFNWALWKFRVVCPWDAARMQAMFSHIQNVNCGDSVATRKQNQAN